MTCLCSSALLKIEIVSDEIGYLAEVISKEIDEGAAWFLLPTNSKMQEERNGLKMESLSKMEPELKYLEKLSQPIFFFLN